VLRLAIAALMAAVLFGQVALGNTALTSGRSVLGSVPAGSFVYYYITVPANSPRLDITLTANSGDPDLYARLGGRPTTSLYGYRSWATGSDSLSISGPASGTWYIGVRGYSAASYQLRVTVVTPPPVPPTPPPPPNDIPLTSGQVVSGSVARQAFAYYTISVPSGASRLDVVLTATSGDPDLYIRRGSRPTTSSYDRSATAGGSDSVSITNPLSGTWYIGVYGYSAASYQLRATIVTATPVPPTPPPPPSDIPLTSGQAVSGSVARQAFTYYTIPVPSGASRLDVVLTANSGDPDLYIRRGSRPTTSSYDRSATAGGSDTLSITGPAAGTWYIGVYGYSTASYRLSAMVILAGTATSREGSVTRYDGVPLSDVIVSFTDGSWDLSEGGSFLIPPRASVARLAANHWGFKRADSTGTRFQGAYAKNVLFQQASFDLVSLVRLIPFIGQTVGTAIDAVVNVDVGARFYEDLDDLALQTQDGREPGGPWMTFWAVGYVEASAGLGFRPDSFLPVGTQVGAAVMLAKEANHDPNMQFDASWSAFQSSVLGLTIAEIGPEVQFRSGEILCSAALGAELLRANLITGTLQTPSLKREVRLPAGLSQSSANSRLAWIALRSLLPPPLSWVAGDLPVRAATNPVPD